MFSKMMSIRNFAKFSGIYLKNTPSMTRLISSTSIRQSNESNPVIPQIPDVVSATTSTTIENLPELGNYPSDYICRALEGFHTLTGLPYWQSIILGTIIIRVCLLPTSIMGQRSTSRITYVKSEVDKLNKLSLENPHRKPIYDSEIQYLYKKYRVNPIGSLINPLIQFPIFISAFFGLRQMGKYYPEFCTGGDFWFTDLAAADPTYILPIVNAATIIAVSELGIRNVDVSQMPWFKPIVRSMGVLAVPLTISLPSGLFLFWCTNNIFSVTQAFVMKSPAVMKYFNILPPPNRPPPLKISENPLKRIFKLFTQSKVETVEFIDGDKRKTIVDTTKSSSTPSPLPSSPSSSTSSVFSAFSSPNPANEPPPKVYTSPPKKKSKSTI